MSGLAFKGRRLRNLAIAGTLPQGLAFNGNVIWRAEEVQRVLGNWVARTLTGSIAGAGYGNGMFVAVGLGSSRVSSDRGETWMVGGNPGTQPRAVAYGNGRIVQVGDAGLSSWSTDGMAWTAASPGGGNFNGIAFAPPLGLFAAVGVNRAMTSADGTGWATASGVPASTWAAVTFANGLFVASANPGGAAHVMTSTDGVNWTARTAPAATTGYAPPAFGNGIWVIANRGGSNVVTSPDGINWTNQAGVMSGALDWFNCAFGAGWFVVTACNSTATMVSQDGLAWSVGPARATAGDWRGMAFANNRFVQTGFNVAATLDAVLPFNATVDWTPLEDGETIHDGEVVVIEWVKDWEWGLISPEQWHEAYLVVASDRSINDAPNMIVDFDHQLIGDFIFAHGGNLFYTVSNGEKVSEESGVHYYIHRVLT